MNSHSKINFNILTTTETKKSFFYGECFTNKIVDIKFQYFLLSNSYFTSILFHIVLLIMHSQLLVSSLIRYNNRIVMIDIEEIPNNQTNQTINANQTDQIVPTNISENVEVNIMIFSGIFLVLLLIMLFLLIKSKKRLLMYKAISQISYILLCFYFYFVYGYSIENLDSEDTEQNNRIYNNIINEYQYKLVLQYLSTYVCFLRNPMIIVIFSFINQIGVYSVFSTQTSYYFKYDNVSLQVISFIFYTLFIYTLKNSVLFGYKNIFIANEKLKQMSCYYSGFIEEFNNPVLTLKNDFSSNTDNDCNNRNEEEHYCNKKFYEEFYIYLSDNINKSKFDCIEETNKECCNKNKNREIKHTNTSNGIIQMNNNCEEKTNRNKIIIPDENELNELNSQPNKENNDKSRTIPTNTENNIKGMININKLSDENNSKCNKSNDINESNNLSNVSNLPFNYDSESNKINNKEKINKNKINNICSRNPIISSNHISTSNIKQLTMKLKDFLSKFIVYSNEKHVTINEKSLYNVINELEIIEETNKSIAEEEQYTNKEDNLNLHSFQNTNPNVSFKNKNQRNIDVAENIRNLNNANNTYNINDVQNSFINLGEFLFIPNSNSNINDNKYYQISIRKYFIPSKLATIDLVFTNLTVLKESQAKKTEMLMKGKMFSKIAHEFKTPLITITSQLDLLNEKIINLKDFDEIEEILEIATSIKHLAHYTNYLILDIISYSNPMNTDKNSSKDSIKSLPISITYEVIPYIRKDIILFNFLVLNALLNFSSGNKKQIETKLLFDDQLDTYYLNSNTVKFNQIVLNILSNSVKFTKSGMIMITCYLEKNKSVFQEEEYLVQNYHKSHNEEDEENDSFVDFDNDLEIYYINKSDKLINQQNSNTSLNKKSSNKLKCDSAVIKIIDTGLGMDENFIQSFVKGITGSAISSTEKSNNMGSGLGINISKQICYLLDYDLTVVSKKNLGTTFTLKFPVYEKEVNYNTSFSNNTSNKTINIKNSNNTSNANNNFVINNKNSSSHNRNSISNFSKDKMDIGISFSNYQYSDCQNKNFKYINLLQDSQTKILNYSYQPYDNKTMSLTKYNQLFRCKTANIQCEGISDSIIDKDLQKPKINSQTILSNNYLSKLSLNTNNNSNNISNNNSSTLSNCYLNSFQLQEIHEKYNDEDANDINNINLIKSNSDENEIKIKKSTQNKINKKSLFEKYTTTVFDSIEEKPCNNDISINNNDGKLVIDCLNTVKRNNTNIGGTYKSINSLIDSTTDNLTKIITTNSKPNNIATNCVTNTNVNNDVESKLKIKRINTETRNLKIKYTKLIENNKLKLKKRKNTNNTNTNNINSNDNNHMNNKQPNNNNNSNSNNSNTNIIFNNKSSNKSVLTKPLFKNSTSSISITYDASNYNFTNNTNAILNNKSNANNAFNTNNFILTKDLNTQAFLSNLKKVSNINDEKNKSLVNLISNRSNFTNPFTKTSVLNSIEHYDDDCNINNLSNTLDHEPSDKFLKFNFNNDNIEESESVSSNAVIIEFKNDSGNNIYDDYFENVNQKSVREAPKLLLKKDDLNVRENLDNKNIDKLMTRSNKEIIVNDNNTNAYSDAIANDKRNLPNKNKSNNSNFTVKHINRFSNSNNVAIVSDKQNSQNKNIDREGNIADFEITNLLKGKEDKIVKQITSMNESLESSMKEKKKNINFRSDGKDCNLSSNKTISSSGSSIKSDSKSEENININDIIDTPELGVSSRKKHHIINKNARIRNNNSSIRRKSVVKKPFTVLFGNRRNSRSQSSIKNSIFLNQFKNNITMNTNNASNTNNIDNGIQKVIKTSDIHVKENNVLKDLEISNINTNSIDKTNKINNILEEVKNIKSGNNNIDANKNKKIILICDDSSTILNTMEKLLLSIPEIKDHYCIEKANDGSFLISRVIEDQITNKIKVIITDENMEYMNGSQAVSILKRKEKEGKISSNRHYLCCSAVDDSNSKTELLNHGFDRVLNKPISKDAIKKCLQELKILK